jgi:hypothetical protein
MATYNPAGPYTNTFVTSLSVNKPDIYNQLFKRDPELKSFFNFMRDNSAVKSIAQDNGFHFEKRSIFDGGSVGTGGSTANGDGTLTFSVPAAQVTNGSIYALQGNLVEFATGQQGRVKAVSGATVTLEPYGRDGVGAIVPLVAVPAGTTFMTFSNAHGEGTGQPGTRRETVDRYNFYTQIFKNSYQVTGSAETTEAWFEYEGKQVYALIGEEDEAQRHLAEIDMGLLLSKGGVTADGVQTTKGLLQYARDRGINATGGITAITDYNALCRVLTKLRAPAEYALFNGIDAEIGQNQLFQTAKYYEGIQYSNIGGEQNAISLGFKSYTVNGYSFHGSRMNVFNHANLAAQDGFSYTKTTLGMPLAKPQDRRGLADGADSQQGLRRHQPLAQGMADGRQRAYPHQRCGRAPRPLADRVRPASDGG